MEQTQQSKKSLPNKITSDRELASWCGENVPGFQKVIDRTEFKHIIKQLRPGQSIIINLDPHYEHGGTHWVALRMSSEAPIIYYKDSFGAPPPADIAKYHSLIYGNRINQNINEQNCGKRAAEWLRDIAWAARNGKEIEWFESSELNNNNGAGIVLPYGKTKSYGGAVSPPSDTKSYKYPALKLAKKKAMKYGATVESSELNNHNGGAVYAYPELKLAKKKALKYNAPVESSNIFPHKLMVEYNGRVIHFGDRRYSDYNIHKDKKRRARYRARAEGISGVEDPNTANFWAYHVLW